MKIIKVLHLMLIGGLLCACTMTWPTPPTFYESPVAEESPTSDPVQTTTITTPAYTPATVLLPVRSPLIDFPLNVGTTWTYHHRSYLEGKTAEYEIQVKVIDTQMREGYFVAEMQREVEHISGNESDVFLTPTPTGRFWYIIDGGRVYTQGPELDLTKPESIVLKYVFPFSENCCFYRYRGMREDFTQADPEDPTDRGGTWTDGPIEKVTPAGTFENCYLIVTPGHAGGFLEWVCPGKGFVGDKYDHLGTAWGYETELVDYVLSSP